MNEQRRELILKVSDGNMQVLPILHQLDGFVAAEQMYYWMIQERMTGDNLLQSWIHDFKGSWLSMGKWIIMKMNKDNEIRKIIAGVDYVIR